VRLLSVFFLLCSGSTAFGQAHLLDATPGQSPAAPQTSPNGNIKATAQDDVQRSTLDVEPGSPAIKQKRPMGRHRVLPSVRAHAEVHSSGPEGYLDQPLPYQQKGRKILGHLRNCYGSPGGH